MGIPFISDKKDNKESKSTEKGVSKQRKKTNKSKPKKAQKVPKKDTFWIQPAFS